MIPTKLSIIDKRKLTTHLQSLQGEERRLRFGGSVNDDYIASYVEKSFDSDSKWFGIDHIDNKLVAACHVAVLDDMAELGCSVDAEYRNQGLAQAMFDRAVTWLRTRGIQDVCMHCLAENGAMKHIARKNDMTVVTEYGESDANVHLEPPTPSVLLQDAYADRMALYDMLMKEQIKIFRRMVGVQP